MEHGISSGRGSDARPASRGVEAGSDSRTLVNLADRLRRIRDGCAQLEGRFAAALRQVCATHHASARNLIHYLALRRHDIRPLQDELAGLGLSSLGRTESHVAAGLDAVLSILDRLTGAGGSMPVGGEPVVDLAAGTALLRQHTEALLGTAPSGRDVRIMVTVPSQAAVDYALVKALVAGGMNCMRINCAHDGPEAWAGMVANLRRAVHETNATCQVLMDVAGPKLRTGPIDPSTQIVKWRPRRARDGRVIAPARIWLCAADAPVPPPQPADATLRLAGADLARLRAGAQLDLTDLRGKVRRLACEGAGIGGWWASASQTAYLNGCAAVALRIHGAGAPECRVHPEVGAPAEQAQFLVLKPDDRLHLTADPVPGRPTTYDAHGAVLSPATISCTLPEVLADVRVGERVFFDDGKIGAVVEQRRPDHLVLRITSARADGERLRADKGINLPDTALSLAGLTTTDLEDLEFVARHADLVGLSFVRRPDDVTALQQHLARLGAERLGIVLKIETRSAFEQLPNILLASMRSERVGVMIARGDLAVECGYQRLAEIQEEILWVCEAAHVPVVWATQVLETLAKKGTPSRAEITDAAMGERAECVMLNKGPHLIEAVAVLDDILRRMQAHQSKKSARLRSLRLSAASPP